jgi:hypothetical protein
MLCAIPTVANVVAVPEAGTGKTAADEKAAALECAICLTELKKCKAMLLLP